MATAVRNTSPLPQTEEELAALYASTLVYKALIEAGDPLKASELARAVGRPDVDVRLTRVVLSTNSHMTAVDRKWTLWTRYLDTRSPTDVNIMRIFNAFGQPIRLNDLAREMKHVYGRPAEVYEEMLARLADHRSRYFRINEEFIAPTEWLFDTEYEQEDEALYENFLEDEQVFPFEQAAIKAGLDIRRPESLAEFLDSAGQPVHGKAIQFFLWRQDKEHFHAAEAYTRLFLESGATPLAGEYWIGPKLTAQLASRFPVLAEQEVSENIEAEAQEAAQPLSIGDSEREQLVSEVLDSDVTVFAHRLLEDVFEVTPDYRTYEEDLQTIIRALAEDNRVVWVGVDRFCPQGTIPAYVFTVPGLLEIPETNFTDEEGNPVDLMLEDDGFEGGLEREILNPLAQDVLDEEPIPHPDPNPPSTARAVVKYHHKGIGTLPLCQFPSGFFPAEPAILETEFTLPGGQKAQVWVNNETRLLYGLIDWFQSIPIDSGATFTLDREAPDRFVINYNEESEPSMFISRNRLNELLALQEAAEAEGLSNFEIMQRIMEHYRKGIEFLTLLTELNIVRRVTRRLAASILSEYHCFFQRGGSWVYDAKKLAQGFDKSKRKFLVK